jgi:hypothetical protein
MVLGRRLFWGRRNVLRIGHDLKGENVLGSVLGCEDNGLAKCFVQSLLFCDCSFQFIFASSKCFRWCGGSLDR